MMVAMLRDLQYGLRLLARAPGFAAVTIGALAIGIAATTTIFSVLDTLLLRPLPYQDADRVALVWERNIARDRHRNVVSPANFLHWREMNQSFTDLGAVSLTSRTTLTGVGEPEELATQMVSAQIFPILGVAPALGRPFTAAEDRHDSGVVVISDGLWRRLFGADPSIVGRPIALGGRPHTVTGIMPPGFFVDEPVDLWLPIGFDADARSAAGRWLAVVGRLKPDVTVAAAQADMTRVYDELIRIFPRQDGGWTADVVSMRDDLTANARPALLVLSGAVALVLLVACANVAGLLLARATARQQELSVRVALGAGRGRLVRQLLCEGLIVAAVGGLAGVLLSWWAIGMLRMSVAGRLPVQRLDLVALDGRVLLFAVAASCVSGLMFSVVPALAGTRAPARALRDGGRAGTARHGARLRAAFVVVEMALAIVLLTGAGLLVRSFVRLAGVDPGFDGGRTLTFSLTLPASRYENSAARVTFFRRLFEHLDASPGVVHAGAVSFLPLTGPGAATGFTVVGQPPSTPGTGPVADVRVVEHDYFKAMGIPLVEGRLFDASDRNDTVRHVIVSASLARRYFPGESALGRHIRVSWGDDAEDEIVGVVGDVHHEALSAEARAAVYWPYERTVYSSMTVVVSAAGAVAPVLDDVRSFIGGLDPLLAVARVRTLDEVLSRSVAQQQVLAAVLGLFAAAGLLLAAIGVYGVMAFSVGQRSREIGIRLALGAAPRQVVRQVVAQGLELAALGAIGGTLGALALTRSMRGLLFDTAPTDLPTFALVVVVLLGAAVLASIAPARRAARVDPVVALRGQ